MCFRAEMILSFVSNIRYGYRVSSLVQAIGHADKRGR
jgi:hypothetical protein